MSEQPNGVPYRCRDHSRVLPMPGAGPVGSPIGYGFTVLWTCVVDSARQRAGSTAFTIDKDDEDEEVLLDPWTTAASALLDAAMALGAPDLVDPTDAAVLTAAWRVIAPP